MSYPFIQSPNYSPGGMNVKGICNHITSGSYAGTISWFQNPASQVSAHFVVAQDGRVTQMVSLKDKAWAQGITSSGSVWTPVVPAGANPNGYLISIEHEGTVGDPNFMNPKQYAADLALHVYICQQMGWTKVDRNMIVGHYQFDRVNRANCPSSGYPFDRLIKDINAQLSGGDDPAMIQELQNQINALTGELNNQKGINRTLQQQLDFCQQLKFQIEDSLSKQVGELSAKLAAAQAQHPTAILADMKALIAKYGG